LKRGGIMLAATAILAAAATGFAQNPTAAPVPGAPTAPGPTGPVVTLTVEEAIRIALANNPNLQATQDLQRQARSRIGEAKASAGPNLNATASYNRTGPIPTFEFVTTPGQPPRRVTLGSPQSRTVDVSGAYRPDISGRTSASVRVARAGSEAAEATTATTINDLTLQTQSSYYTALRNQELVEVRRQAVAAAQEQLRVAQAEFRAGTKPQFDVLRASVQVENQRQNQTVAENNARISLANLIDVLGIDPNTQVQLTPVPVTPLPPPLPATAPAGQTPGQPAPGGAPPAPASPNTVIPPPPGTTTPPSPASAPSAATAAPGGAPLPTTESEAFAEALSRRPEVQQATETVRLNRAQVAFEARARRPELALTGGYTLTPDASGLAAEDHQWRLGASLSLDIFDGGLIRSRVRQAEAGQDSAEARLAQVRQQVALDVRTALLNLQEAAERRQTTAANVQQAQEALRIAQVRYRAGVSTNVEVTDAQVALTEAQTNQVNAEYDYLNAEAALARALGRYAPPTAGRAAPPAPVMKRK
jgi:outer membrane protein